MMSLDRVIVTTEGVCVYIFILLRVCLCHRFWCLNDGEVFESTRSRPGVSVYDHTFYHIMRFLCLLISIDWIRVQ